MRRCLRRLESAPLADLMAHYAIGADNARTPPKLSALRRRAALLLRFGLEGAMRREEHSHGYYQEGHLHNLESFPPPCCTLTLDGPTSNRQNDEWRCHTMMTPSLRQAQWLDDDSLAGEALGETSTAPQSGGRKAGSAGNRVPAAHLAGVLYTLSVDRSLPTNRSLTPRWLQERDPEPSQGTHPRNIFIASFSLARPIRASALEFPPSATPRTFSTTGRARPQGGLDIPREGRFVLASASLSNTSRRGKDPCQGRGPNFFL